MLLASAAFCISACRSSVGTEVQSGPYTITTIAENVYHIQDCNDANPSGESFNADGSKSHFNNCSDIYLCVGACKALLIDLSNEITWADNAAESLRSIVYDRIGDKELLITFTHNHGDHTGMFQAFKDDTNVLFMLPYVDFKDKIDALGKAGYEFIDDGYQFDLGGMTLTSLLVPGHTAGSMVFFLDGEDIMFSGDAIGSGHGVWIFDLPSFKRYTVGVDRLVRFLEDSGNGIDTTALKIYGGHYWQKDWFPELGDDVFGMQYVRDMQELIDRIGDGTAATEPSNLNFGPLDTYFKNGQAIIAWNAGFAEQYRAWLQTFHVNRGVNIAHWLSQSGARGEQRKAYFTEDDVKYIASLGFDHVRIPIDEEQMFTLEGEKEAEAFGLLHNAIDWCMDAGLRVIVDLHILRSHYFNADEKPLFTQRAAQEQFYECWRKLSGELATYPQHMVAYELMNEPVADRAEQWNAIAYECYKVVRALEPERVIVIGSNRWQGYDTIKDLKVPQGDPNIMLSFHYYRPFLLTHYEASWTGQKDYHGAVHYPGVVLTPEEYDADCPEGLRADLEQYVDDVFDMDHFRADFKDAYDVAASYGLPIYCGEYGCLSAAPEADRLRWHRDMETVFDEMGIARALWCYREGVIGFGVYKIQDPDTSLIKALGL